MVGPVATILIIDDRDDLRRTVRRILESEGHEVLEAPNGSVGMQMFREHKPALVITDVMMPDMDGIETLREIREHDPKAKVIAISGNVGDIDYLTIMKKLGATETLEKPFGQTQLVKVLARVLGSPHFRGCTS
jgi:CheY-like chemotaxis protein